ncbi:MAG: CRTAC1 family protein, partial [Myxococcales bacterium]|nr:CRTAC1 family protein [Myxococcales bacterium]
LFGGARSRRRAARARAGSVVLMSRPGGRDGRVRFERRALGARQWWSWVALADQDNDGDLDLLVRIAQPSQAARAALWRGVFGPRVRGVNPFASKVSSATLDDRRDALWLNAWRGELVDAAGATALGWRAERGAALLFDIDGDGDLDLVRGEHVTRWRGGEGGLDDASAQHALLLELRSRSRANRQGLGARVELVIEGRKQVRFAGLAPGMAGAAPGRVHFGVGSELRGEKVTVWWPGGEREVYPDLPVDRLVRLVQGGGALWGDRLRAREPAPSSRPVTPPATRPAPPASRPSATRARAEVLSLLPGALRRRFAAALRKKGAGLVLLAPAACAPCVGHCRSITKLAAATKTASLSLGRAITRCTLPHAAASRSALRELAPLLPAILVVDATGKVRTTSVDFDATRLRSDIARLRR